MLNLNYLEGDKGITGTKSRLAIKHLGMVWILIFILLSFKRTFDSRRFNNRDSKLLTSMVSRVLFWILFKQVEC